MKHQYLSPYFTFQSFPFGQEPDKQYDIYALRYQVYCKEKCFLSKERCPNGLETDEYDPYSAYMVAYSLQGELVGSARLVHPPKGKPFPFRQHCLNLYADRQYPDDSQCAEISRLCISKTVRRRLGDDDYGTSAEYKKTDLSQGGIALPGNVGDRRNPNPVILIGLFRQMYRHCKLNHIDYWYSAVEKPLARLMQIVFNFVPQQIGAQVDYYGPVVPFLTPIKDFEEGLASKDPAMFRWFQESLNE